MEQSPCIQECSLEFISHLKNDQWHIFLDESVLYDGKMARYAIVIQWVDTIKNDEM